METFKEKLKKMTTKNLKIKMDNLTFGCCFCINDSEKFNMLLDKFTIVEKEFYQRRNHKQYLKNNKRKDLKNEI